MSLAWAGRLRDLRLQKRHELPGTLGKKVINGPGMAHLDCQKIMNPCRCPSPTTVGLRNTLAIAFDGEKSIAALAPRLTAKTSNALVPSLSLRSVPLSFRRSKSRTIAWRSDVAKLDLPFPHVVLCVTEHAQVLFCALFTRAHAHFDGGLCIQRLLPALDPIAGNRKLS